MLDVPAVGLERLLAAREERAARQSAALARFGQPLVSATCVMPGPVKNGALPRRVFTQALEALDKALHREGWRVLQREVLWPCTGPEALYVVDADGTSLKSAAILLEDRHPWGRLWDLDVIVPGPRILSRKDFGSAPRRCLVCERPAAECGRSRRHRQEDLVVAIREIADGHDLRSTP